LVFCVVLCFCVLFVFSLCLVCPMLPASLDQVSVLRCVFVFCLSSPCVLCAQCCQRLWIGFLCCVVFLCFVCLHPVSCVPNVASVSGFVFCDCSFSFLYVYLLLCKSENVYSGVRVYFMLTELCPLFTGYRVLIPLRHLSTMRPAHWK
jgi:hypothetical protein